MMKTIEDGLKPLEGYLISINRDTVNGWYELEIGLPKNWVFKGNEFIGCETLQTTDTGVLLKISPKEPEIYIDDLVAFVVLVMNTNAKIAEKEKEFSDKMEEVKRNAQVEAEGYYKELADLKEISYSKFETEDDVPPPPEFPAARIIKEGGPVTPPPEKKRGRGRPPGAKNRKKTPA